MCKTPDGHEYLYCIHCGKLTLHKIWGRQAYCTRKYANGSMCGNIVWREMDEPKDGLLDKLREAGM